MKQIVLSFLLLFAGFAAMGESAAERSAGPNPKLPEAAVLQPTPSKDQIIPATNAPDSFPLGTYVLDDKHKLLPGDRIGFQIVEDRTNAIPMMIAESSELDIPYIGRVSVAGKTCKQAAEDIKALLDKDYYYNATVVIGLDALTKVVGKVYIYGPVRNPGPQEVPANENFTASKAVMRAGGFGDFANKKDVQIVRKTETGNKTIRVNLENVFKGRTEEDVVLEPDDFIIVRQRSFNF